MGAGRYAAQAMQRVAWVLLLTLAGDALGADRSFEKLRAGLPGSDDGRAEAQRLFSHARRPFAGRDASLRPVFRELARRNPRSLALGLRDRHPDVRRLCLEALDYPWVQRRGLLDDDPLVRFAAGRMVADPLTTARALLKLGSAAGLRGTRQLLLAQPPTRRYRLLLALPAQPMLINWLAEMRGADASHRLRDLAATDGPVATAARRALLGQGDAAALGQAWSRLTRDPSLADAEALAIHLGPDSRERLDRLLTGWEKSKDTRYKPLLALLSPLYDHLERIGDEPDPSAERQRLARLLATGGAQRWMLRRHQRLVDRLLPGQAGVTLAALRIPAPGKLGLALIRLWAGLRGADPSAWQRLSTGPAAWTSPNAALRATGLDPEQRMILRVWRPAPQRPFSLHGQLRMPFPAVIAFGLSDRMQLLGYLLRIRPAGVRALSMTAPGHYRIELDRGSLALRFVERRCLIGPHQAAIDDFLAGPAARSPSGPTLELPVHHWIAQAQVPSLLSAMANLFVEARFAIGADLRITADGARLAVRIGKLPQRISRLLTVKPARLIEAPRKLLPRGTRAVALINLRPEALVDLVRDWPLKWYQKPVGFLAGSQKEKLVESLMALRSEAGVALLPDGKPILFVQILPERIQPELGRLRKGGRQARVIGNFLVLADKGVDLRRLGKAPFMGTPGWKTASAGYLFVDSGRMDLPAPLGSLGLLLGRLDKRNTSFICSIRHRPLMKAQAPEIRGWRDLSGLSLPVLGTSENPPARLVLEGTLLGAWPRGPGKIQLRGGKLRLTLGSSVKPGSGLLLDQGKLRGSSWRAGRSARRIPLTKAQVAALLFRSYGWRIIP